MLGGWTKIVTLHPKAAPEERIVTATTVGHPATVQKRMTLCLLTARGKQSGTAELRVLQTNTALQNPPDLTDTGPLNPPQGLSLTPVPLTMECPTHCRAVEMSETGAGIW